MSSLMPSVKKAFSSPAFSVAAVILLLAAAGLNGATQFMQLHFKKQAVPMRRELSTLPPSMGNWRQVSEDQPLSHELQDVLQTDKYIFRDYVDVRRVDPTIVAALESMPWKERRVKIYEIQRRDPLAVINCAVTYYTGKADTVAHIPDRCYIADGYQPSEYTTPDWTLTTPDGRTRSIGVRFINFEDQGTRGAETKSVAYFFQVNGRYESDPMGVRYELQNLFVKHGYYAKIELMTLVKDRGKSAQLMTDFLSGALPEVEKCLPDWNSVTRSDVK